MARSIAWEIRQIRNWRALLPGVQTESTMARSIVAGVRRKFENFTVRLVEPIQSRPRPLDVGDQAGCERLSDVRNEPAVAGQSGLAAGQSFADQRLSK